MSTYDAGPEEFGRRRSTHDIRAGELRCCLRPRKMMPGADMENVARCDLEDWFRSHYTSRLLSCAFNMSGADLRMMP